VKRLLGSRRPLSTCLRNRASSKGVMSDVGVGKVRHPSVRARLVAIQSRRRMVGNEETGRHLKSGSRSRPSSLSRSPSPSHEPSDRSTLRRSEDLRRRMPLPPTHLRWVMRRPVTPAGIQDAGETPRDRDRGDRFPAAPRDDLFIPSEKTCVPLIRIVEGKHWTVGSLDRGGRG
jgi:hypothetical protein